MGDKSFTYQPKVIARPLRLLRRGAQRRRDPPPAVREDLRPVRRGVDAVPLLASGTR